MASSSAILGYELIEIIGEGGMGAVWRAKHPDLAKVVAVKLIHPRFERDPRLVDRFIREAQLLIQLQHPNVVRVENFSREPLAIVMEHVSGGALSEWLRRGPLPIERALRVFYGILEGVGEAHRQGIVHRDLKPENVIMTLEGSPKIADFGIARALGGTRNTRGGEVMGTEGYMAPEQGEGADDPRVDIYALGVLLYELLTGARRGGGSIDLHLLEERGVSAGVIEAIEVALSEAPEDRHRDTRAFARALEEERGGETAIPFEPYTPRSRDEEDEREEDEEDEHEEDEHEEAPPPRRRAKPRRAKPRRAEPRREAPVRRVGCFSVLLRLGFALSFFALSLGVLGLTVFTDDTKAQLKALLRPLLASSPDAAIPAPQPTSKMKPQEVKPQRAKQRAARAAASLKAQRRWRRLQEQQRQQQQPQLQQQQQQRVTPQPPAQGLALAISPDDVTLERLFAEKAARWRGCRAAGRGIVRLRIQMSAAGRVTGVEVRSPYQRSALERCLMREVQRLRFGPLKAPLDGQVRLHLN